MGRYDDSTIRKKGCRGETLTTLRPKRSNWLAAAMVDRPVFSTTSERVNVRPPFSASPSTKAETAPVCRCILGFGVFISIADKSIISLIMKINML